MLKIKNTIFKSKITVMIYLIMENEVLRRRYLQFYTLKTIIFVSMYHYIMFRKKK